MHEEKNKITKNDSHRLGSSASCQVIFSWLSIFSVFCLTETTKGMGSFLWRKMSMFSVIGTIQYVVDIINLNTASAAL